MPNTLRFPFAPTHLIVGARAAVATSCAVVVLSLAGCGGPARPTLTPEQLESRAGEDMSEIAMATHGAVEKLIGRISKKMANATDEPPTLQILAMSGGGDFGAFGAGFLVGWGDCADAAWVRPDFDVVTGVSTGAMLAPFAFVGTDEALLTVETFYRNPRKDWIRERGPLFFLPSNASFATIPGLERDLRATINPALISQMAAASRAGKSLGISATDLDLGRQKFWEVGAEAEAAEASGDGDRVHRIMLASAAIPGVFPPVAIGSSIYGDGGVTANILLRLDPHHPQGLVSRWRTAHPDKPLPRARYWIIINNQLKHVPETVQEKWPAIIGSSLDTAIRSATLAEVRWLAAQADYVNARFGADIEVRVVAIPDAWRPPTEGSFERATMDSLATLGREMGADPSSWTLWTAPRIEGTAKR